MRIGIVAPEFPPSRGGMQAVAHAFASGLAAAHEVVVYTREEQPATEGAYAVRPILAGSLDEDSARLSTEQVDVWFLNNAGYAPLTLRQPYVVYCHGNDFLKPYIRRTSAPLRKLVWPLRKIAGLIRFTKSRRRVRSGLAAAHGVLVNSEVTKQRLLRTFGFVSQQLRVVYPGVDAAFFQPPEPRSGSEFRLLTVSRLDQTNRRKNVDGVLRAIARMKDIPISYAVVGDGSDRARLEQLAEELRIADRVRFLGEVDSEGLLRLYAESDLFVLAPRQTWHDVEGFGIVYVEAAASGVPSLGASRGGRTDAIQPGVTGELVADPSPEAIEQGVRRMWRDRDAYNPEAVQRFAEQFRWEKSVADLEAELVRAHECRAASR